MRSNSWRKMPDAADSPVRSERASHLVILIVCFGILAGALILEPPKSGSPYVRLCGVPLPDTCAFRGTTGLPCPGCGLLRSIVAAVHGDVAMSFTYHRLGLLTLVYIFLQFGYHLGFLVMPIKWTRIARFGQFLNKGIIVLGILFMLNWILTLFLMRLS